MSDLAARTAAAVLPAEPVTSVAEAIERMEAVAAALPETDGVACFNRMYLTVTRQVGAEIGAGFFADPGFMDLLDVVFANFYLSALRGWAADPSTVCRSWTALIDLRSHTDRAPMQFALAGMNAHINHDLPLALMATCRQAGTGLDSGSHHDDFEKVNAVLARLDQAIRQSFETGVVADLDRQCPGLENVVANFSITAAREVAWTNADTIRHLGDNRFLTEPFIDSLDRFVAFAGRGLLCPLL